MSEISFSMKTTHPQTKMTVCERDRFILCESDHLRRTVPSRGLSGDTTTCAILTPSTITVTSVGPDERKVYFTSSSVHDASTQTPPLALNPRKRPSCQSFGEAGRIRIRPSWLCRSISASAAGNPRCRRSGMADARTCRCRIRLLLPDRSRRRRRPGAGTCL